MRSSFIPVRDISDLWAKSTGENIARHTLKVLGNLGQLRQRSPWLSDLGRMPRFWLRAALAVALHDLGKCCEGFQQVVHGGARFPHRHEVMSAVFVRWILARDQEDDLSWAAATIITHHKDWPEIDQLYRPPDLLLESTDGLEALRDQMGVELLPQRRACSQGSDMAHAGSQLGGAGGMVRIHSPRLGTDRPRRGTAGSARSRAASRRAVEGAERAHSRIDCGDLSPRRDDPRRSLGVRVGELSFSA